jgi:adenylate cyclase, class 2
MAQAVEREVKLRFESPDAAREAVLRTGATRLRGRRLQEDSLLDTADDALLRRRCVLRVRMEAGHSFITFKGPPQPSSMKLREELETMVGDGPLLIRIFEELGFHVWFRYEKYREEYALEDVIVAIDETPLGTFVEVEGGEAGIAAVAAALGRGPSDYILESYRGLYAARCRALARPLTDMLFEPSDSPGR